MATQEAPKSRMASQDDDEVKDPQVTQHSISTVIDPSDNEGGTAGGSPSDIEGLFCEPNRGMTATAVQAPYVRRGNKDLSKEADKEREQKDTKALGSPSDEHPTEEEGIFAVEELPPIYKDTAPPTRSDSLTTNATIDNDENAGETAVVGSMPISIAPGGRRRAARRGRLNSRNLLGADEEVFRAILEASARPRQRRPPMVPVHEPSFEKRDVGPVRNPNPLFDPRLQILSRPYPGMSKEESLETSDKQDDGRISIPPQRFEKSVKESPAEPHRLQGSASAHQEDISVSVQVTHGFTAPARASSSVPLQPQSIGLRRIIIPETPLDRLGVADPTASSSEQHGVKFLSRKDYDFCLDGM